jgi:hypothetical protein
LTSSFSQAKPQHHPLHHDQTFNTHQYQSRVAGVDLQLH